MDALNERKPERNKETATGIYGTGTTPYDSVPDIDTAAVVLVVVVRAPRL